MLLYWIGFIRYRPVTGVEYDFYQSIDGTLGSRCQFSRRLESGGKRISAF